MRWSRWRASHRLATQRDRIDALALAAFRRMRQDTHVGVGPHQEQRVVSLHLSRVALSSSAHLQLQLLTKGLKEKSKEGKRCQNSEQLARQGITVLS